MPMYHLLVLIILFFLCRENPELYLGEMRTKYKELCEKVEQRKRLKTNGNHSNGNGMSGGVGRGERLNAAQRERMRLLTTAAFDRGKGEDNFGAKDEDWQLYKLMSKDNDDDDEGPDEDETELARVSSRLQVRFIYSGIWTSCFIVLTSHVLFLMIQLLYGELHNLLIIDMAGDRRNICSQARTRALTISC